MLCFVFNVYAPAINSLELAYWCASWDNNLMPRCSNLVTNVHTYISNMFPKQHSQDKNQITAIPFWCRHFRFGVFQAYVSLIAYHLLFYNSCNSHCKYTLHFAEVICPDPPQVPYSERVIFGIKLGDSTTFTCDPGMRTDDGSQAKTITCLIDETWSETHITCGRKYVYIWIWMLHRLWEKMNGYG